MYRYRPELERLEDLILLNGTLIAYWKFDNNAADATGHGYDGTLVGSPPALPSFVSSVSGLGFANTKAIRFDGTGDQHVSVPNLDLDRFLVSAWIRRGNTNDESISIILGGFGSWGIGITRSDVGGDQDYDASPYKLYFCHNGYGHVRSLTSINDTNWHHVAVSYDGSAVTIYIDGVFDRTRAYAPTFNSGGAPFLIGSATHGNTSNVTIDDLRIYAGAASPTKVLEIFSGDPPKPVVNITGFTTDTGVSATDRITMSQNLSISGLADPGSTVTLKSPAGVVGTATANSNGTWTIPANALAANGAYSFTASALLGTVTTAPSPAFVVKVDNTPPAVSIAAPAQTASFTPTVTVYANDLNGLPDGTVVTLEVDADNDGTFDPPLTAGLQGGRADFTPSLGSLHTKRLKASVTDRAGNTKTTDVQNITVVSAPNWEVKSVVTQANGLVQLEHPLDLDLSPGTHQAGSPSLVYDAASVNVLPIIQLAIQTANVDAAGAPQALPPTIHVELTWDGQLAWFDDFSTASIAAGDLTTLAVPVAGVSGTGRHTWSIALTAGVWNHTEVGTLFTRDETASPFGAGWSFAPWNRLFPVLSGNGPAGQMLLYGSGGYAFFAEAVPAGTFVTPSDDNGILRKNTDGTFTYYTPEGNRLQFDNLGYQSAWQSADLKTTISFSVTAGLLNAMVAIDGAATTFNYHPSTLKLQSIVTPGPGTFQTTIDAAGDLTLIQDPDGNSQVCTYDTAHRLTRETRGILSNGWRYSATTGRLDQFTCGNANSPTIYNITPANAQGLGTTPYKGPTEEIVTDARNYKTTRELDAKGRTIREVAADSGVSTWTYDPFGNVLTYTDPLGRLTTYQRDSEGYVTLEILPGGATKSYNYFLRFDPGAATPSFHELQNSTEWGLLSTYGYTYISGAPWLSSATQFVTDVYGAVAPLTTFYNYNPFTGLLSSVLDPMGKPTAYLYDGNRRLWQAIAWSDPAQAAKLSQVNYTYDIHGNLDTATDALNLVTDTDYDKMGRLTKETTGSGDSQIKREWRFNSAGLQDQYTNEAGHVSTTEYDAQGRGLVKVSTTAVGTSVQAETIYNFNVAAQVQAIRAPDTYWTSFVLDPMGRPTEVTNALQGIRINKYDFAGQVTDSRDELGYWTNYEYHPRGWVSKTTNVETGYEVNYFYNAAGQRTSWFDTLLPLRSGRTNYDELGRSIEHIDGNHNSSHTRYWADGRVMEVRSPLGTLTEFDVDFTIRMSTTKAAWLTPVEQDTRSFFDAAGFTFRVVDPLNYVTYYEPNTLHQIYQVKDNNGTVKQAYTYNGLGQFTGIQDALSYAATTEYDGQEDATKVTDANSNNVQTFYDNMGRKIADVDGLQHATRYFYDALGRNTFIVDANGGITQKKYDALYLREIIDPSNNKTTYKNDDKGRPLEETDPYLKVAVSTYDDAGRLKSVMDRNGNLREYEYDPGDRRTKETWKDANGAVVNTLSWTYNAANQILTAMQQGPVGPATGYTYTYDALGRLETQIDPSGHKLTWIYQANSNRLDKVTDTMGGTRTYTYYDATSPGPVNPVSPNNVKYVTFTDGTANLRWDFSYNKRDDVTEIKRYSDLAGTNLVANTVYTIDPGRRVERIQHLVGATTIGDFGYTYDQANRVQLVKDFGVIEQNLAYDDTNQVKSDGAGNYYNFDKSGNRTSAGSPTGVQGYQTILGNRLFSDFTWTYSYDYEGNLVQKWKASGEYFDYKYNEGNQLIRVQKYNATGGPVVWQADYSYDALGNRSSETIDPDGTGANVATTAFAYDNNGNAWLDTTPAGYTRRLYLDAVDALFAKIDPTGAAFFYLTDRLGSVREIVDITGATVKHLKYDAFGNITINFGTYEDRYGWTGRERDDTTGLQYNRGRYYSFDVGRFINQDPLGFGAGDMNVYRYVGNNATNLTDPDGQLPILPILGLMIFGGMLLGPQVANAPAPGDRTFGYDEFGTTLSGSVQSVAAGSLAYPNAIRGAVTFGMTLDVAHQAADNVAALRNREPLPGLDLGQTLQAGALAAPFGPAVSAFPRLVGYPLLGFGAVSAGDNFLAGQFERGFVDLAAVGAGAYLGRAQIGRDYGIIRQGLGSFRSEPPAGPLGRHWTTNEGLQAIQESMIIGPSARSGHVDVELGPPFARLQVSGLNSARAQLGAFGSDGYVQFELTGLPVQESTAWVTNYPNIRAGELTTHRLDISNLNPKFVHLRQKWWQFWRPGRAPSQ